MAQDIKEAFEDEIADLLLQEREQYETEKAQFEKEKGEFRVEQEVNSIEFIVLTNTLIL